MKKLILIILVTLFIGINISVSNAYNVRSNWVDGNIVFQNNITGEDIFTVSADTNKIEVKNPITNYTRGSARASTLNNATITIEPEYNYYVIDTYSNTTAVCTVNIISTENIPDLFVITLTTRLASQDIVLLETGNLCLSGTLTHSDPQDKTVVIYDILTYKWVQLSNSNNN